MAKLHYINAKNSRSILLDLASTSIGRSQHRDLVLSDPCVSRLHAIILREDSTYTVVDQGSTHGTWLNRERIQRATLKHGDLLQLGSLSAQPLRVDLESAGAAEDGPIDYLASQLLSTLHDLQEPAVPVRKGVNEIEQLNWLLRAARLLNEGGAVEEILSALLQVTLQLTGVERGFVFLREPAGMRLALGLDNGGKRLEEDSSVSRHAMQKAIDDGVRFSISDTLQDSAAAVWDSVLLNRIRSIYCIPLRARVPGSQVTELLGLLYLDSQVTFGTMSEIDHQLLDTLATEAAALLHNALLAEGEQKARQAREELAVAAAIHSGLMSMTLPTIPYAKLQAKSVPCLAMGGDFYDVVLLPNCVCVTIADVSGKGVSAAIVAAILQGIIHSQLLVGQPLAEIASLVNQFLCARNVGKYATMVILKLYADGHTEFINCGHVQPLAILHDKVHRMEEGNLVVGLIPDAAYLSSAYKLRPGERILIATDGITEAESPAGDAFGYEGLYDTAQNGSLDAILDAVARFEAPAQPQDDCTLLQISYTPPA